MTEPGLAQDALLLYSYGNIGRQRVKWRIKSEIRSNERVCRRSEEL